MTGESISALTFAIVIMTVIWTGAWNKIDFPHNIHQDQELDCTACHTGVTKSQVPADNLLPEMATCYNCHEEGAFADLSYHNIVPAIVTGYIAKFSHKQHLAGSMTCEKCHAGVEKSQAIRQRYLPGMQLCVSCHQISADAGYCYTCHGAKEDLLPADHRMLTWKTVHGIESQQSLPNCVTCHTVQSCSECHEGDNLDHKVHPLNYQYNHGIHATANKTNCFTCHEEQASCNSCHRDQMVLPKSHAFANWSNGTDGGKHARAARMDLDTCISCHSDNYGEPVCAQCHQKK